MGGYGSGRRGWRIVTEACRVIDINYLRRKNILLDGCNRLGSLRWTYASGSESSISVSVYTAKDEPYIKLHYKFNDSAQSFDYNIKLTTTEQHFGGRRWWFICPLTTNSRRCGQRVSKLYLPPGGLYFGCRHCYNLTYTSCNESHRFDMLHAMVAQNLNTTISEVKRALRYG